MPDDALWDHSIDESDAPATGPVRDDNGQFASQQAEGDTELLDTDEDGLPISTTEDETEEEIVEVDEDSNPIEKAEGETEEEAKSDQPTITLDSGATVSMDDVESLFARKATIDAEFEGIEEQRKSYETLNEQGQKFLNDYGQIRERLFSFVQGLIPDEPNIALAGEDPAAYQYQVALRNKAVQEVEQLLAIDGAVYGVNNEQQTAQASAIREREERALLRYFPQLRDTATREKFNKGFRDVAKHFGFSEEEISSTVDHRIGRLVYYANLGLKASKGQGRRKVVVKKTAAAKARPAAQRRSNTSAMNSLRQSGSIEDAMKVNFKF